jgi:hypothetical protein
MRLTIPSMDADRLLAAALRHNRLAPDWGAGLREPLARLVESCRSESRFTAFGRIAAAAEFGRLADNALAIERAHAADPAAATEPIRAPLFITGLPRSGSSFLHALFACDPASRAPLAWEAMCASPGEPPHRRIARTRRLFRIVALLRPRFRHIQPLAPMLPQECITIMAHCFLSYQFHFAFRIPAYQAWLKSQDLLPSYLYHRRFLQVLQRLDGAACRWVLKAPSHLFALPALFACYPDARILQLHRDPLVSITSMASFTQALRRMFTPAVDSAEIGREQAELWAGGIADATGFRAQHPELAGRFFDLRFAELRRDPLPAMEQIYGWLGWNFSPEAASAMRRFLADRQRRSHRRHSYEPEAFGLQREGEWRRFRNYSEQFGVAAEVEGTA